MAYHCIIVIAIDWEFEFWEFLKFFDFTKLKVFLTRGVQKSKFKNLVNKFVNFYEF